MGTVISEEGSEVKPITKKMKFLVPLVVLVLVAALAESAVIKNNEIKISDEHGQDGAESHSIEKRDAGDDLDDIEDDGNLVISVEQVVNGNGGCGGGGCGGSCGCGKPSCNGKH